MLGKTLLLYLKEKKYDVLRLDRNEYDAKNTNINLLRNVLEKKCCDVVVNCCGLIKQRKDVSDHDFVIVNGFFPILISALSPVRTIKLLLNSQCPSKISFDLLDSTNKEVPFGVPKNSLFIPIFIIPL